MTIAAVVLLLGFGLLAYVRLAPSDVARWHVAGDISKNSEGQNSVRRLVDAGPDGLAKFAEAALRDPRTEVLAGSAEDGLITVITRTRSIGYPDYTTAWMQDGQLAIYGRSRFGRKDFGVNAARVDRWIGALSAP
ncbi:DUF1499 domain-containing protein [Shimia haliotis]|uniref:DUF1499 domain-containing protein n=1 Tax=Shimia haliotis TaxID=1280847 RepID=A0A1I4AU15_9RHOB|nr:DUF1499 domain-containing protein [Shimia haliotis]SFK59361.1 Protein of unknown function [Shimia haliotis]